MKSTLNLFLISCICLVFILGCGSSSKQNNSANDLTISTPYPISQTKVFEFAIQGGRKIKADITESESSKTKLAIFTPTVERTDGNLYAIALALLDAIYGKGRGLIQLKDARIKPVGNNKYVCWEIANPKQDFCVAPIDKSDTDKSIGGVSFYVE